MKLSDLTEEQKAKALECKTVEDVLSLAQETGYDLSDDELEAISGGWNPFEKCENNDKSF
jgi:hypothetical protein